MTTTRYPDHDEHALTVVAPVADRRKVSFTPAMAVSPTEPPMLDHVRYSAYGVPWATSLADVGAIGQTAYVFAPDGQITYDDSSLFANAYNDADPLADVTGVGGGADQLTPPDGQLTVDDVIAFYNAYADDGGVTGRGVLSRTHSRCGYAGYEFDPGLELASRGVTFNGGATIVPSRSMWHVRNRVLDSETGRWTRRDPLGYVDGMSVYEYVRCRAVVQADPSGQWCCIVCALSVFAKGIKAALDGTCPFESMSWSDWIECILANAIGADIAVCIARVFDDYNAGKISGADLPGAIASCFTGDLIDHALDATEIVSCACCLGQPLPALIKRIMPLLKKPPALSAPPVLGRMSQLLAIPSASVATCRH